MQDGGALEVIEPYQPVSSKARRRMWGPPGLSDIGKRSYNSMDWHAGLMRKPRCAVRRSGFDGSLRKRPNALKKAKRYRCPQNRQPARFNADRPEIRQLG